MVLQLTLHNSLHMQPFHLGTAAVRTQTYSFIDLSKACCSANEVHVLLHDIRYLPYSCLWGYHRLDPDMSSLCGELFIPLYMSNMDILMLS